VSLADIDPVQRVRERLLNALQEGRDPIRALLEDAEDFADAVYQLNLFARIEGRQAGTIELEEGLSVTLRQRTVAPEILRGLSTEEALQTLQRLGALLQVESVGLHPGYEVIS